MSLLNLNLNLVAYADEARSANPMVKFADLSWSILGLPTSTPRSVPIALSPGQTSVIMSLERAITYNGSTSFVLSQVLNSSNVRIATAIGQRVGRVDGDGTTQWAVSVTNQITRLTHTGTGTAPTFSGMVAGDGITIESPFAVQNIGSFTIVRVGSNYVEFEFPFALAETVIGQVEIYSSGPVQVGDQLDITSPLFSYPNRGQFRLLTVTDTFVEFSNPESVPETVTSVAAGDFTIYPEAYEWLLLAVDRKVVVRCNGDTGSGVEVQPVKEGDLVKYPGLMLKQGKIYRLDIYNPGLSVANGFVFLAE